MYHAYCATKNGQLDMVQPVPINLVNIFQQCVEHGPVRLRYLTYEIRTGVLLSTSDIFQTERSIQSLLC